VGQPLIPCSHSSVFSSFPLPQRGFADAEEEDAGAELEEEEIDSMTVSNLQR